MGFLAPKVPDAPRAPNPAATAISPTIRPQSGAFGPTGSLITSSPAGLGTKNRNKVSLIGGG